MHIAVIGSGYVGLVTGACFAEFGVDVTCVDIDADKIAKLSAGEIPIYEPGLEQLILRNIQAGRLRFTTDIKSAVDEGLVIFLAVGTPPNDDGSADLSYIEAAARSIAAGITVESTCMDQSLGTLTKTGSRSPFWSAFVTASSYVTP